MTELPAPVAPAFRVGDLVRHPQFGLGRIAAVDGATWTIRCADGEARKVAKSYPGLVRADESGDPEFERLKLALREVLGETGHLDADLELAPRWRGGSVTIAPGREGTQPRSLPIEALFKKLIGIREKLRVLEQKINNHPRLLAEDKLDLQGYITRSYGSLTSFNMLFADRSSWFVGSGGKDGDEDG